MAPGLRVQHRRADRLSIARGRTEDQCRPHREGARASGALRSAQSPDHGENRAPRRHDTRTGLATQRKGMNNRYMDGSAAAEMLERRWFAAFKAASRVRAECEALLESMALTEAAWSRARVRLCELESLRSGKSSRHWMGGKNSLPRRIPAR